MKSDHSNDLQEHGISEDRPSPKANIKHVPENDGKIKKYEKLTKSELMEQAKNLGIEGRNMMDKHQIIKTLRKRNS